MRERITRSLGCNGSLLGIQCPKQMNVNSGCRSFALDGSPEPSSTDGLQKAAPPIVVQYCNRRPAQKRVSKRYRSLAYAWAFLERFHSIIRTVKPVEQSCRLPENPKFRNRTLSWKDRCVGHRAASRLSRKRRHQTVGTLFPIILNPPGRKRSPRGDMCL